MRFLYALALSGALSFLLAQAPAEDPEVLRAQVEVERVRSMVQTGAVPRVQLQKAEAAVADAQDAAIIRKTIYSQDLTEAQATDLVDAASRRFERRKQAYDDAKKLVDAGIAAQNSLEAKLQELDFARTESQLAGNRAELAREIAAMAEAEAAMPRTTIEPTPEAPSVMRFDGNGVFTPVMLSRIETAFSARFGKPLPISANGDTAVHRALGFDHTGRVDVAVHPDEPEGVWLMQYLVANKIPYFAFRQAVAGKATGAHIHIGPGSTHVAATRPPSPQTVDLGNLPKMPR
jgi:hypothetical protein